MKRNSLVGLTVFFSFFLIIFACRKEIEYYVHDRGNVPSILLESAKIWHLQHLDIEDPAPKLIPQWNDAWIVNLESGDPRVIVPTSEHYISNRNISIRRFFIFQLSENDVVEGRIIEFLGKKYNVNDNIDFLIKSYSSDRILNFDGAVLQYDVNYQFVSSNSYSNGQKTNLETKIVNLSAEEDIKEKIISRESQFNLLSNKAERNGRRSMTASGNDCEPPAVFVLGVPIGLGPTCTITFNVSYQYFGQCVDEVTYTYMSHTCPSQGSAGSGSGSGSGSGGSGGGPPYGGGGSQPSTTIDLTFCSGLSSTQRANIEDAIQEAASLNCATHVINMALANKPGLEIGICVDGTNGSGTYNAATKSITFLTDFASTHVDVVRHELFHAYQDNIAYPGGISDYSLGEPGYSNIEFEQALFKDIMMLHGGNATALSYSTDNDIIEEYESWINYLTNNGTEYPDFSNNWSLYESKYFEFLEEFKNTNPYYNAPIINTLAPEGLKRLFYGMLQPDCEY